MTVTFYTFSKRVNSTAQPTGGTDYTCIIKEGCSVQRPSIRLKYAGTNPSAYNYAYLADFGRYYWVRDWYFVDRQWEAELEVDVLASYKSQIGSSSQYVVRSASSYDTKIVDGLYPTNAYPSIETRSPQYSFWTTSHAAADQVYIISTMGTDGLQQYYAVNGTEMANIAAQIFGASGGMWSGSAFDVLTEDILKAVCQPETAVVNVQWLPLTWSQVSSTSTQGATSVSSIDFSFYTLTGLTNAKQIYPSSIYTFARSVALVEHPDAATRGVYLNGNAYTMRELFIPGVGSFAIDSDKCHGCEDITITTRVNLASGSATFNIVAMNASPPRSNRITTHDSKVSVDFGYGTTRVDAAGITQGVLNSIGAAVNGNMIGLVSGIVSSAAAAIPRTTVLNSSGSIGAYQSQCYLTQMFYRPVNEDLADRGRPLCQVKQISTLSGYVKTEDATMSLSCTSQELNEILGFMNGGFFYE